MGELGDYWREHRDHKRRVRDGEESGREKAKRWRRNIAARDFSRCAGCGALFVDDDTCFDHEVKRHPIKVTNDIDWEVPF